LAARATLHPGWARLSGDLSRVRWGLARSTALPCSGST